MHDQMPVHLELYQADLRRRGLSDHDARRRALADFGSLPARREECREAIGLRLFDELRADVTYAVRLLRTSPAFTIVALLSLALGIGANTAIFSLIDTVLVKRLPVDKPQQLFFSTTPAGSPAAAAARLAPSIRASVAGTIPGGFVAGMVTIEQQMEMSLVRERMLALLGTFFAGLALLLACIGLHGVMAYRVARRTREIGIRIAIGARSGSVVWMMVRETLLLVAIGAAVGTLASLGVNRYISAQLFGVTPGDPTAITAAVALLGCVTLIAGYVPARHASRVDPVRALRSE